MAIRDYKYMHTINGKPATFNKRYQRVVSASAYVSTCDTLTELKAQQRISKQKDVKKSRKKYGYLKVFVE